LRNSNGRKERFYGAFTSSIGAIACAERIGQPRSQTEPIKVRRAGPQVRNDRIVRFFTAFLIGLMCVGVAIAPAAAVEPYDIYAILSLTGPIALIGNDQQASLETIEALVNKQGGINGRPIHFVIEDDQSQPAIAVQVANTITAKGVPLILGPTYVASCLAVAPLIRVNGPVMYCFAPAIHPPAGSYAFSTSVSTADQATAWFNFALSKQWKRIAVFASTDATGQDQEQQIATVAGNPKYASISVVDREHFAIGEVSVAAQAARIKAANPDLIIVTSVGTPTGTALHGLKDGGLENVPVITSFGNLLHSQLEHYAGFLPNEMYLTAPRFVTYDVSRSGPVRDAQRVFYTSLGARGIVPDAAHSLAWDPTLIIIDALRHLGTATSATAVRDYLETLHGFAGTIGIFDYRDGNQRGVGLSSVVVVKWNPTKNDWSTVSATGGTALR
jgi:branched-chain amino acid transport system substrate-binding protein